MRVRNSNFTALIEEFTTNTFIMVITSDDTVQPAVIRNNIKEAQKHFDQYIKQIGI